MRKLVITISIIFSVFVITSCASPIGTLEGSTDPSKSVSDPIWLVPRRLLYQIDERFLRNEDFQIFIVLDGVVKEILPTTQGVEVRLTKNLLSENEYDRIDEKISSPYHMFHRVGKHEINVTYLGRTSWYAIEVFSPNNGNSLGGDGGFFVEWAD